MNIPPFNREPASPQLDQCTKPGAQRLARIIRGAWAACGHRVHVEVQPVPGYERLGDEVRPWQVRANLVAGLPPA